MTKRYRDLIQGLNEAKKNRAIEVDGENDEAVLEPRSVGERDFVKASLPVHPGGGDDQESVDRPYPTEDADDTVNARGAKRTTAFGNKDSGDRSRPKQGNSEMPDKSGFKWTQSSTPANNRASAGDKQIVRISPSAVKTQVQEEDVLDSLERIADGHMPGDVVTEDGRATMVNPNSARALLETFRQLRPDNAQKFRNSINEGTSGLLKMMKFVGA